MSSNFYRLVVFTSTGEYVGVFFSNDIEESVAQEMVDTLDVKLVEEFELLGKTSNVIKTNILYFTKSLAEDVLGRHDMFNDISIISIDPETPHINETLAHEIAHAKQWVRGDTTQKYLDGYELQHLWKGNPKQIYGLPFLKSNKLDYYLRPWEVEAYIAQFEYRFQNTDKALRHYSSLVFLEFIDNNKYIMLVNMAVIIAIVLPFMVVISFFASIALLPLFCSLSVVITLSFTWFCLHRWGVVWFLKRRMKL